MATAPTRSKTGPCSRADWLAAALELLAESGVEAVRITELSRRLGVTRGSFYWHFEDRGDLLDSLIDSWRHHNTGVMVDALAQAETLTDGILRLFSVWVDHGQFDPRLDQALRDWARHSPTLAKAVGREDDSRIAAIAGFFRRFGYDDTEAFIRARVIYFTQISYYALDIREPMARRMSYLAAYFRCFTGEEIDPEEAADYSARMIETWKDDP